MSAQSILIAEDDFHIRSLLKLYLESEGYAVICAENGQEALELWGKLSPDLAVLDIMMPKLNGYDLTQMLRRQSSIPIVIISSKNQDNDKILGLNIGADDYITKPFNPLEVVARVKALLRRSALLNPQVLTVGELELDTVSCVLTKNGIPVQLTPMEHKILTILMRSPGRIFTKMQLYQAINGEYFESDDNTMMVHISKLREKIEADPKNPKYIITVRGLGYKIEK